MPTNFGGGIDYSVDSGGYGNPYAYSYENTYNMVPQSYATDNGSLGLGGGSGTSSSPGVAGVATGLGAVAGSYDNASTSTGTSALSGAASGAAAGAAFGPWGAVIGGVVGAISGYFGAKKKKKDAKKAFNQQKELAIAQIQEQEKNYQTHQKQLSDAMSGWSKYANSGHQMQNGLLSNAFGPPPSQQGAQAPQGMTAPQAPAQQAQAPQGDPSALAAFYNQQNQNQQAAAMAQYGGLLRG